MLYKDIKVLFNYSQFLTKVTLLCILPDSNKTNTTILTKIRLMSLFPKDDTACNMGIFCKGLGKIC